VAVVLADALNELADLCACCAGDMHTLHLNFEGVEFDNFHKKVFKEYYEQLDEDYDSAAEWLRSAGTVAPNKNGSAVRVGYKSFDGTTERQPAIERADLVIQGVLEAMTAMFAFTAKNTNDALSIAVNDWLQGRIGSWYKEAQFFNYYRKDNLISSTEKTTESEGEDNVSI
jgi:DNA-binding ferritin-like protein